MQTCYTLHILGNTPKPLFNFFNINKKGNKGIKINHQII